MSEKTIYEMDLKELKTLKKSLKSEISTMQVELNNYSVSMVIGVKMEKTIKVNGQNSTVNDFMESEKYENAVNDLVENYGTVCSVLFAKKGEINNKIIKEFCSNLGISKQVFWKTLWKDTKIKVKQNKLEQIQNRETYLNERQGEKMEDSE